MKRSHSSSFVLKKRDGCAVCNNIAPCPACPKGQQCQQIFRASCQDCPVNKCVAIPGYTPDTATNKSALGGGLAALFIFTLGAAFAVWFWRRLRAKRRRIALHENALERREKRQNEKEATTLQLGGGGARQGGAPDDSPFAIADDDDDTEYTQATGVLHSTDDDALGALAAPTAFRRRSFGAATHLSRITEGAEEDEDEVVPPLPATPSTHAAAAAAKRNTAHSVRSFASSAGPRVSIGSGTSFGSHNIIPIAFKPSSAAAAAASHDADVAGSAVPLPSTAHRLPGAPVIEVNTARQAPVRPTRAPDLNLRLPETQRHVPATSSPLRAGEATYGFMSIDPVDALPASVTARTERPVSAATMTTIASTHSASLSYVLSAPQVITPVSGDGVRRVQLGNGGKAQLVKAPSLKRKPAPEAAAKAVEVGADPFEDPRVELVPPGAARFDAARGSTVSTSTLGIPFGENPFAGTGVSPPEHGSPLDADERQSWLASDPFGDPATEQPRVSIGGLSLLADFPFQIQQTDAPLPQDAQRRVEQHK